VSEQEPSSASVLHRCDYIAIQCACAGEGGVIRQALPAAPVAETTDCPQCHEQRGFTLLGAGYTVRPLPFHEIYRGMVDYSSVEANGKNKIAWSGQGTAGHLRRKT
jgi:hypothetical protein